MLFIRAVVTGAPFEYQSDNVVNADRATKQLEPLAQYIGSFHASESICKLLQIFCAEQFFPAAY